MSTSDFTPSAERLWRDIGPAARDNITSSVWCGQCRTAVEIVEFSGEDKPGGLVLRGTCKACGGPVARFVEIDPPPAPTSTNTPSQPFRGLDSRAAHRLLVAGYRSREEVLAAVQAGRFAYGSPDRPRYYGRIHHQRVLEWLGLPVPDRLPLKPSPGYTMKQGQYLAFIHYYTKINGCPPAEADFQRYFMVSPPVVHGTVLALERGGWITREPGKPRSIRLTLRQDQIPDLE